jgi:hypothetical protein
MIISGATGPLTVNRNEVSNPDGENTHTSDVANPLEGLAITTGFAPSEQEDVPTEYAPMAATSRAEFPAWGDPGLELRPVTTISFPVWEGAAAVSGTESGTGGSTAKVTLLETSPSGFRRLMEIFPEKTNSDGFNCAVHSNREMQKVLRAVPPTRIAELGPELDVTKLPPATLKTIPETGPEVTLDGLSVEIMGPLKIVTGTLAKILAFALLRARMTTELPAGRFNGAV